VTYGNQPIALTPKEYSLLELFLRNPQRVFSRSTILDHLWSMDDSPTEGAVTNLVKDLRNRLKRNGLEEAVIQTVYGLGYRLKSIGTQPAAKAAETTATTKHSLPSPGTLASIATRFQRSIQQRVEVLEDATRALQSGGIAPPQRELAGEEAHRLAGGLGTFGYAQGSALARQIEQLLQRAGPLDRGAIAQLSQHLLALKQAVVGQPTPTLSPLTRSIP
jgi:DNA-binding winged helix-turn-helix (wHTH) protein